MKRFLLVLMCLFILASGVFAGGKKEAAMEENKVLRVLSWSGYILPEQVEQFKEETGITLEITLSSNEEMISKLRATRGGGFDLAQPSQDRISAMVKQFKLYQPIDYTQIDEDQIEPSMLKAVKANTLVDGESYAVPHVFGTSGLIVNSERAPDVKDYKDLLDPKYKSRVAYRMKSPTLMAMGFSFGYDPFALYDDKEGYQKYLDVVGEKLVAGKPVVRNYWENGDALLESMRSGEVWAAMGWEQQAWKLYKENPAIDYIAPASGSMAWIDTFTLPAKSENVSAAYKLINFLLKPENAAAFTNAENYGTASKDAADYLTPEAASNFKRCFTPEIMANMNWYPTMPPGLEEMNGKVLDKIRASK